MGIKHNNPPIHRYVASGSEETWPYQFRLFADNKADMVVEYNGVSQPLSAFTITGGATDAGGGVTPVTPPAAGTAVVIRRRTILERITDYTGIKTLRIPILNLDADRMIAGLQEVTEQLSRTVQRPASSGSTAKLDMPDPSAGKAIKWNADATGLENTDHDLDTLGDAVEADRTATETALADTQAALATTQAALAQVQALVVTAQNSAAASEAAAQSIPQGMVKRISADYQIPISENGYHYVLDGTANDVTLTAPLGSDAGEPFKFSGQRADSSDNTVKVVASGDNTFNAGATQIVLPYANSGVSCRLDIDPEPDNWSVATSGALSQLQEQIFYYTATEGQTVFTGADDFGRVLGFTPGRVEVYLINRLWAEKGDYSDASGDAIVLAEGTTAGDEIAIIARSSFSLADTMTVAEVNAAIAAIPNGEIGSVQTFAAAPSGGGWLEADGAEFVRTANPDLFAAIGTEFGEGDGSTTANLPNVAPTEWQETGANIAPTATVTSSNAGTGSLAALTDGATGGAEPSYRFANATGPYFLIEFSAPVVLNHYAFDTAHADIQLTSSIWFEGSNDNSTWTRLDEATPALTHPASYSRDVANTTAYKWYLLQFNQSTASGPGFYEIYLRFNKLFKLTPYIKAFHAVPVPTPGPQGVNKAGDDMTGPLGIPAGTLPGHAVNKEQLDALSGTITQALTVGATQEDIAGIPAEANRVVITFGYVSFSSTDRMLVQLGTDAGFVVTGYDATSTHLNEASTADAEFFSTGMGTYSFTGGHSHVGRMTLERLSGNVWVSDHVMKLNSERTVMGAGLVTLPGDLSQLRITGNNAGTFASGTIKVKWEV